MKRGVWLALCAASCQPPPPGGGGSGAELRIIAVDVGQGDCTLVIGPDGTTVLIDGGGIGRADAVAAAVMEESKGRVDHVVVTHYDADHLAGLADFMLGPDRLANTADDGAPGAALWDYGDDHTCTSQTCEKWRQVSRGRVSVMEPGQELQLGGVTMTCVAVNGALPDGSHVTTTDENSRSVAFLVEHGDFRAFLGGDLTGGGEGTADVETPVARYTGRVDLLKVDHHGSLTSTATPALAAWTPRAAVISAGTDNTYCHPSPTVMQRLEQSGPLLFATGEGITATTSRCTAVTPWPPDSVRGSTVRVSAWADGRMEVDGLAVP
ncbi:MAG: MBL fold metallo-hydrolase [Deltaproteobacteria bacterium]|nr:MBL fold metallo-hydrolase [Deltaproteobacteria bacterium]